MLMNNDKKKKGNEDVIKDKKKKGNNDELKIGNEPVLSDDHSSVYSSEFSFHSSSDEGRKPPPEWFNDLSIAGSVSCHSSDTSDEEYTGCPCMSVHKTPTSRKYLKRKEKVCCIKSKAFKKKLSKRQKK
jgi:hypothetical protein